MLKKIKILIEIKLIFFEISFEIAKISCKYYLDDFYLIN